MRSIASLTSIIKQFKAVESAIPETTTCMVNETAPHTENKVATNEINDCMSSANNNRTFIAKLKATVLTGVLNKNRGNALYNMLKNVTDPRDEKGQTYKDYAALLYAIVAAALCGYTTSGKIRDWIENHHRRIQIRTGLCGVPSVQTIDRVFRYTDPVELGSCLDDWLHKYHFNGTAKFDEQGYIHISGDGKAARGAAKKADGEKPRYVLNFKKGNEPIQCMITPVGEKKNECGTLPGTIEKIISEVNTILTTDAAGLTYNVLDVVTRKGWSFMMPLKGNQGNMFNAVKEYVIKLQIKHEDEEVSDFDKLESFIKSPKKCHGRKEEYVCTILSGDHLKEIGKSPDLKDNLILPFIKSVAVVRKTTTQKVKGVDVTTEITRFYVSNIEDITPEYVLELRSKHWSIEASHYLLDMVFDEDRSTRRSDNAMVNGCVLRRFGLAVACDRRKKLKKSVDRCVNDLRHSRDKVFSLLDVG